MKVEAITGAESMHGNGVNFVSLLDQAYDVPVLEKGGRVIICK